MADSPTIFCPLADGALTYPGATALETPDRTLTYSELDRQVSRACDVLRSNVGETESRVGLYLPNGLDLLIALWACLRAGLVAAPVSKRVPSESAADQMRSIGVRTVLTDESGFSAGLRQIDKRVLDSGNSTPYTVSPIELPMDRVWTALFTSGSSGKAKAALHTFGAHVFSARGSATNIPVGVGDRWMLSLPLNHVGGFAISVRCWLAGATVVFPDKPAWSPKELQERGITHLSLVSTQLGRLLDGLDKHDVSRSLKAVILGGSAMPKRLIQRSVDAGLPIHISYGSTEMASQIATSPPCFSADDMNETTGKLLPWRSIRFAEDGELMVRGATRFLGYATDHGIRLPFDDDGWFPTGDMAIWKGKGRFQICGRKDQMFISGGENIHPHTIENAILDLAGIEEAVVVPVPDREFGSRPVAFVRTSTKLSQDFITKRLRQVLPGFLVPDRILPLPEDRSGFKPNRFELAAIAQERLPE